MRPLSFPDGLVGQKVTGIARVLYERHDALDRNSGPLELEMDGRHLLFEVAGDGERLRVKDTRWEDPFAEPLSEETRLFVEEHGKWTRVDVSRDPHYSDFIGQRVKEVRLLNNRFGRVAGARISVEARSLWFVVDCDECYVYWAQPFDVTEDRGPSWRAP